MSNGSRLKITDVLILPLRTVGEVGELEPAWDPGGPLTFEIGGGSYVEIRTDQGLVGIGPGMDPDLLPAVKAGLVGKDPFDIESHVSSLRYYAQGQPYRGTAGVDIALWDVIRKACGQPLYKLWGGSRDKVIPYDSLIRLSTPDERARMAVELASQGWKAIKLRLHHPTMREDIETVEKVREVVGDEMVIMVDANQAQSSGNWQPGVLWDFRRAVETARELQRLGAPFGEVPISNPRVSFDE